VLGELHGGAHIEIDQPELVGEVGVGREGAAGADAGIQRDRVDRAAVRVDASVELVQAIVGSQVGSHSLDAHALVLKLSCRVLDVVVLRHDEQVEPVLGELPGELEADAARSPSDQSQLAI
jgi:hypothetical protein